MIMRGPTAARMVEDHFYAERRRIARAGYRPADLKKILKRFDAYMVETWPYLCRKIIVFKYHFNHLWLENGYWIAHPRMGAHAMKCYNTATFHIDRALRDVAKSGKWLPENCWNVDDARRDLGAPYFEDWRLSGSRKTFHDR